jgi:hypothetical protein
MDDRVRKEAEATMAEAQEALQQAEAAAAKYPDSIELNELASFMKRQVEELTAQIERGYVIPLDLKEAEDSKNGLERLARIVDEGAPERERESQRKEEVIRETFSELPPENRKNAMEGLSKRINDMPDGPEKDSLRRRSKEIFGDEFPG